MDNQIDPLVPAVEVPATPPSVPPAAPAEDTKPVVPVAQTNETESVRSDQSKEPEIVIPEIKSVGPSLYGYKPPKWSNDFEYVRTHKGQGSPEDAKTWLLFMVDRVLKIHS